MLRVGLLCVTLCPGPLADTAQVSGLEYKQTATISCRGGRAVQAVSALAETYSCVPGRTGCSDIRLSQSTAPHACTDLCTDDALLTGIAPWCCLGCAGGVCTGAVQRDAEFQA